MDSKLKELIIDLAVLPEHVGSTHLRLMLTNAQEYGCRTEVVEFVTLYITIWYFVNHSIPLTDINLWNKLNGVLEKYVTMFPTFMVCLKTDAGLVAVVEVGDMVAVGVVALEKGGVISLLVFRVVLCAVLLCVPLCAPYVLNSERVKMSIWTKYFDLYCTNEYLHIQ